MTAAAKFRHRPLSMLPAYTGCSAIVRGPADD
jgi:hypothetical protein